MNTAPESELELLRQRLEGLEERYASLRQLVYNLPIGLFAMEEPRSGRLTQVNPAAGRMFGFATPEELEAVGVEGMYADPKERSETFARFLADPRFRETGIAQFETMRLRSDGTAFPALITVSATFREDGSIARFDGAIEDLTERKRAERRFAASEERFRIVFETIDVGVALTDMEGKITRANPALCRFLHREEQALVGVRFDELLADAEARGPVVGRACEEIRSERSGSERRFAVSHGGEVVGFVSVTWLADGDGRAYQSAVVVQDVTMRRNLEDQMARVAKLESLSLLAGGIAHDFNNFLAAILGNVTLALEEHGDRVECLTAARDATMRARDVTRQLLTFARGGEPIKRSASLVGLVREAASFSLQGRAIECVLRETADVPPVEIDAAQIAQVFGNLFLNAAEAMPRGGRLDVEIDCLEVSQGDALPVSPGSYVRASVTDRGVGIPPDVLPRVFDPYFTTKARGSGLGLAMVHSIVKRHGGHVDARSDPTRGTTFTLVLPASSTPIEAGPPARSRPSSLDARVLVMDDEPQLRAVLSRMLTEEGCECVAVADGAAAVSAWTAARAEGRPFDLAILDLTVRGGLGGEETMRRLRALDPTALAIVSSGYADNPVMSRYAEYGFAGVARKPYTPAELVEILAAVLSKR